MRLFVQFRKAVGADMVVPPLYMRTFKQKLYKTFYSAIFSPRKKYAFFMKISKISKLFFMKFNILCFFCLSCIFFKKALIFLHKIVYNMILLY